MSSTPNRAARRAQILKKKKEQKEETAGSKITTPLLLEHAPLTPVDSAGRQQLYQVFAYVSPKGARQSCEHIAVNFLGTFQTEEEADAYCKSLAPKWPYFDTFIVETGKWIHLPLPETELGKIPLHYDNPELEKIMDGHRVRLLADERAMKQRLDSFRNANTVRSEQTNGKMQVSPSASSTSKPLSPEDRALADERGMADNGLKRRASANANAAITEQEEEETVEPPRDVELEINDRLRELDIVSSSKVNLSQ